MAAKKSARDPFAYFSAGGDLDVSDLSSDEEEQQEETKGTADKQKTPSFISKSENRGSETEPLPKPTDLFEQVSKPIFLKDRTKGDIDWDRIIKDETKPEEEVTADIRNTNSVPPPKSYDPETDALKPTLGGAEVEEDKTIGTVTSAFIRAVKRAAPQQSGTCVL